MLLENRRIVRWRSTSVFGYAKKVEVWEFTGRTEERRTHTHRISETAQGA